jgi:predicted nucleic acid-binding protein
MNKIESVLLDNSFVTRLLKSDDEFHGNVVEYFEYFLKNKVVLYLSTIVVSEYAVADDPDNLLALNAFQILEFDYNDAKTAGEYFAFLKDDSELRNDESRKVIINDLKLFAQINNRGIHAFITKDRKALKSMIEPLVRHKGLSFEYLDLTLKLSGKQFDLFN